MLSGTSPFASQLSSMSVYDNVAYQLRLGSPSDDAIHRRVTECLDSLHLTDFTDLLPEQISDRARRRMALARALAPDTALIILDAPETVFDPTRDEPAVRAVLDAQERNGATLIVATSNLELARRLAQHLAILHRGRIVAQGNPVDLLDGVDTTADFINLCRQLDDQSSPDPDVAQSLIEAADQARRQLHRATLRYYLALLSAILFVAAFIGLYYLLLAAAG